MGQQVQELACFAFFLSVVLAFGQTDVAILLELKKGFAESSSREALASWNSNLVGFSGCPQKWYGVTCSNGSVTALLLDNLNLVGRLDFPVLSGLKSLQNLSLSSNHLTGAISNIGFLESLQYLDLSFNMFDGVLPSGFTTLADLKSVDFSSNNLTGDAMDFLSQLGEVRHVDLSNNRFTGSLDLGLCNSTFISSVEYINVSSNLLGGTLFAHDGIPFFDSLTVFDASNNKIIGTIPPFQFIVSLQVLKLGNNALTGSIPEVLLLESSMVLSELDLSFNQLKGPVRRVTSATLKIFNVSSNMLSGPLPATVGNCAVLDFSNNMFSGSISRIQSWSTSVEELQLSSNKLIGSFPNETLPFYRLTSLRISNNSLNGNLPQVLTTYPNLRVLDLSYNFVGGSIQQEFFTSTTLNELNLSHNSFSGEISLRVTTGYKIGLLRLDLSHNILSGSLPTDLCKLKNLLYINLSSNKMDGVIPRCLPDKLNSIDLSSNNFSGVLPDNLQKFPDSSFHPGNQFLIISRIPMSFRSPVKHGNKVAQLIGLVSIVAITVVVCILGFCCICRKKDDDKRFHVPQERLTKSPHCDKSPPSCKLEGRVDDAVQKSTQHSLCLSSPDNSFTFNSQHAPDGSAVIKVTSPKKLGEENSLHLFDTSVSFTSEDLSSAPAEIVGRSCHGTTYKVTIGEDRVLSVKWLTGGIARGNKEFVRELRKLGDIKHPNLLSYHGCYVGSKDHEKMIISTYAEAHNLAFHLKESSRMKLPPLSLNQRLAIAIGLSGCLNHLHNERAIPHGNLKSLNILIDPSTMSPILTDYSLHRLLTTEGTAEQVLDAGALGYMPPEFSNSSKPCPSLKSDVYAFGVILLELLTGRSAEHDLTDWISKLIRESKVDECFDMALIDVNDLNLLREMLRIALKCVLPASDRPDIKTVFLDLSSLPNTLKL